MKAKTEVITQGGYHAIKRTTTKWGIFRTVEYFDFKSYKFVPPPRSWIERFKRLWIDSNDFKIHFTPDGVVVVERAVIV